MLNGRTYSPGGSTELEGNIAFTN